MVKVCVWRKKDEDPLKVKQVANKCLPKSVLLNAGEYSRESDLVNFLISRMMLLNYFDSSIVASLKFDERGKPLKIRGVEFSISHTAGAVAVAFSDTGCIGLDLEQVREIDITAYLPEMNEQDRLFLKCSDNEVDAFFELWTKKESVMKADGRGFLLPFSDILVATETAQIRNENKIWHLRVVNALGTYKCIVCHSLPIEKLCVERFHIS